MLFVVQGKLCGQAVQHSLCVMGEQARCCAVMMLDVETACVKYFCMGLGCWLLAACSCNPVFLTLRHILQSTLHAEVSKEQFGILENNAYSHSCWELDLKFKTNLITIHTRCSWEFPLSFGYLNLFLAYSRQCCCMSSSSVSERWAERWRGERIF